MISSLPLAWALTALFAVTGVYSLVRWSAAVSAGLPAAHRTAELAHVVMSAAMVVMTWTWYGTTGEWVQIALFTVFGAFFAVTAVRGIHCGTAGRAAGAAHALMAAAMVWMVAAMPLIMPMAVGASSSDPHAGHHGGSGSMDTSAAAQPGQAGWAVAVTVVLCAALLVAAGFWAVRAAGHGERAGDPLTPDDPATGTGADAPGSGTTVATGAAAADATDATDPAAEQPDTPGTADESAHTAVTGERSAPAAAGGRSGGPASATALAERPATAPRTSRLGAREDAACHAAMSAGMVLMLVAMVLGW